MSSQNMQNYKSFSPKSGSNADKGCSFSRGSKHYALAGKILLLKELDWCLLIGDSHL